MQRVTAITGWVMRLKPVRVFTAYAERRGPVLASGLAFQAIFAVFAAIWVGFSVAGVVIRGNPELTDALVNVIATSVPGLIDTGDGGAIDLDNLLSASILGWTGVIAAGGLLFTALGWLAAGRDAVRVMFDQPAPPTNFALLKLKDLGLALAFAVAIVVSAALTVFSTSAIGALFGWLGINNESTFAIVVARVAGLAIVLALDTVVLGAFYRVVATLRIPMRMLVQGSLIGAAALGVLKILGTTLLGGATNNPLLLSFAVIIGLLIWFNFVCQVILIGASWIATSARDAHVDVAPKARGKNKPTPVGTAL